MLVAIDTSTAYTGVACYDESGVLAECNWLSGRNHTSQLLPQLTLLLDHIGRTRTDIRAVGVALGPGSWSGLRAGLSAAKGLAIARAVPLVGVSTLDALVYQHWRHDLSICPVVRLGRERFATAQYATDTPAQRTSDYLNLSLAELMALDPQPTLFCGELDSDLLAALAGTRGDTAHTPRPADNLRRSGFLAALAWQRWQAGHADDLTRLEPIYLGQPVKQASN